MGPDDFDLDSGRRALLEEFETWTEWPMATLALASILLEHPSGAAGGVDECDGDEAASRIVMDRDRQ